MSNQYVICADGACSGNPGPGGWAYEIWNVAPAYGNEICGGSGSSPETTNNIMELRAAISSIEHLLDHGLEPGLVKLRFDSEYVLKGIFEWRQGWKSKGWKTASKKPVKNVDLWQQLDALIIRAEEEGWTFEANWVKGHDGEWGNERVDTIACQRRDEAKEEVASGGRSEEGFPDIHQNPEILAFEAMNTLPTGNEEAAITGEQATLLRDLLHPYTTGDVSVKDVLKALRRNARELGFR